VRQPNRNPVAISRPRNVTFKRFQGSFPLSVALGALALAGCAVGPDYHRPATAVTEQWKAPPPWKEAQPREAEIKENFWELFDDPVLNNLEVQTTTNNPDIRAALARVDEARAVARVSRADLMPGVDFDPYYNRARYSANRPLPPGSSRAGFTANDFVLPMDLSYEVDLWGRVRRSFRAARNQAQASAADFQNVLLALRADVAVTYFALRSVDVDRRVLRDTIVLRRKNLTLVQSLHEGGAASALDVARADTELATAEADLAGYDLRRAQLENALGTYCGISASAFALAEDQRLSRPPEIPAGLPADLLERRPDVAEAERSMAAANEGIGIAKAAFFPAVRLTAAAGIESADLKSLFNWESRIWNFGPSVDLPIFEGGRVRADLARARAAYDEAVARYRSQVLVAFHEVEDGLVGVRLLRDQLDAQTRAVAAAQKAADLSRNRYKEGLVSYFDVVDAERTLLDNQLLADDLNGQVLATSVVLIKALGGGWRPDQGFVSGSVAPLQK
jgi:multidrug efflux system outer membrane protein